MLYVIFQIESDDINFFIILVCSFKYIPRLENIRSFYFQESSFRSGNNEHTSILKNQDDLFQQRKITFNERLNVVAVCYPSNARGPADLSKIAKFLIIFVLNSGGSLYHLIDLMFF